MASFRCTIAGVTFAIAADGERAIVNLIPRIHSFYVLAARKPEICECVRMGLNACRHALWSSLARVEKGELSAFPRWSQC
jgi:hypothetical protein